MKRLKNLLGIKERTIEEKILDDLWNFDNGRQPYSIRGFCKKWNIENKQKYIGYQLRAMKRKLNIACKMEQEDRITKYNDVLQEYMEIIKKQIPSK